MFAARGGFFYTPAGGGFGNNAYFPNNANQFLSVNSTAGLVTWKASTGFTIEYWIYMLAYPGTINPGPGNQDASGTNYWSFGPADNGRLEFYYWGSGQQFFTTTTGLMNLNTWYNVSAVFTTTGSSTTASLYINGVRQQIQWNKTGSYLDTQTVTYT